MNTANTAPVVAVLGIGAMGAPIARNLARKGFAVRAWNRTRSKAEALTEAAVFVANTPAEAVDGASVVLTVLKDAESVRQAITAAAPKLGPGMVWAQISTVGVDGLASLAALAASHGLAFYDAPVQGSRQPAEAGQLVVLASGPQAGRAQVQPVFDAIGKRTLWVGDEAGQSSRLKLALNHYAFALTHAIAESLKLAEALGADPRDVVDVVSGGPMDNGYFQLKGAAILSGDFSPSFALSNAVKDAELIVTAARDNGLVADVAEASLQRFRRAADAGHGDKDMAASFLA